VKAVEERNMPEASVARQLDAPPVKAMVGSEAGVLAHPAAELWAPVRAPGGTRYIGEAEAELIRACVAGDQAAWEVFITRHQDRVYNVTFRMTHDPDRAADLAQEALLQILRSLPRFRGEASLTTWIHGLTMRVCLHHLRREKRRKTESWEELAPYRAEPEAAEGRPLEAVSRQQVQRLVHEAVSHLSLPFRSVIVLHGLAGMTYEETAAALGLPVNTVKTRVHRAKGKLRTWLEQVLGDEIDAL
jgi:RNA polymerase sigma-70 factor (ECF subfamily)